MNNVSFPKLPPYNLYNVIPTAGVAGTAKILLRSPAGQDIYYIAALVIPATAANLYTEILANITAALDATQAAAILARTAGFEIVPSVELRYTTSGGTTSSMNSPAPVATSIDVWNAGTAYLAGQVDNR